MKHRLGFRGILLALFLATASAALASTTWYVNGVNGSDSNDCKSSTTACKTIGHAIALAASGDSVKVAAAIYNENMLNFLTNLNVIGDNPATTVIDGGGSETVVLIGGTTVTLSRLTIRNGDGGISNNQGTLTITNCAIVGNNAFQSGAAINSYFGSVTINNSTVSGNLATNSVVFGGGILNEGSMTINNSTITRNTVQGEYAAGGDIYNDGTLTINNSTITGGIAANGGGGIYNFGAVSLQNTIVANNPNGGNCSGTFTSNGYNLSSDGTCNFNSTGDLNNTDPNLGPLRNNGGPTKTQALLSGSPAIDAGNPNGCTDSSGNLLKTDQRGKPRPDREDSGGCDMGAYERQTNWGIRDAFFLLAPELTAPACLA